VIESLEAQPEDNRPSSGLAELYEALTYLLLFGFGTDRYREALAAAERQEELARSSGIERLLVRARALRSMALSASGISREEGLRLAEEVIPVAEAQNDLDSLSLALIVAAEENRIGGRLREARAYKERSVRVTQWKGDRAEIAFALGNLAEVLILLGEWEQARILCEQQADLAPSSEGTWISTYPLLGLGVICCLRGEWSHAAHYLREALEIATRNQDVQGILMAQIHLAELDLLRGQGQSALARLEPLVGQGGMHFWGTTTLLLALARTNLEAGDQKRAADLVVQAIERARARDERLDLVEALRVSGMMLSRRCRWEEAHAAFDEALSLARSMPYPYQIGRILYEQGKMQGQQAAPGTAQHARERLEEACEIFRRLGAQPCLERIEQALAASR
jgi:tetratricopeptide (TPR) repeat protein